jgi:hypothetical protein
LSKDSLWQGKWNYEVYGDADKKWNPKNNFCNLPATFMRGINIHFDLPILLNIIIALIVEHSRPTVRGLALGHYGAGRAWTLLGNRKNPKPRVREMLDAKRPSVQCLLSRRSCGRFVELCCG